MKAKQCEEYAHKFINWNIIIIHWKDTPSQIFGKWKSTFKMKF